MEDQFVVGLFIGGIIGFLMKANASKTTQTPIQSGGFNFPTNNNVAPGGLTNPAARRGYILRTYPGNQTGCSVPYLNNVTKVL